MKKFKIENFIEEGYLLIRKQNLRDYSSIKEEESFLANIVEIRQKMKLFFELPLEKKKWVQGSHAIDPKTKCYYSGWLGIDESVKELYGMDFPLEYYYSRDLYSSTSENICFPKEDSFETQKVTKLLPSNQIFSFGNFIDKIFINPLLKEYSEYCKISSVETTLQIQTTYYPNKTFLGKHQDSSFLDGIVGPAEVFIFPNKSKDRVKVKLELGDIILYTGKQFKEQYKEACKLPIPLPHSVEAEKGRMALLFGCWYLP